MSDIVLPDGARWITSSEFSAREAVRDYDSALTLAMNERTGDWCIFMDRTDGGPPYPVFGLGRTLPSITEIRRKLFEGDVKRQGGRIVEAVERNNRRVRDQLNAATHEAAEETAEVVEFAMRKLHATSHKKVVLNERVKK